MTTRLFYSLLGRNILPLFFLILLIPVQAQDFRFEHIRVQEGLSHSSVYCVLQDQQGFLWFGTRDGLNKYDGTDFTVYRHDPDNPNSLTNNDIRALYQDKVGIIWIGTWGGGLNRFDPTTVTFENYQHDEENLDGLSDNNISVIYEDQQNKLWLGTENGGLNIFDRQTQTFSHFRHQDKVAKSLSHDGILAIYEDRQLRLWIGTESGLDLFIPKQAQFKHYQHDEANPQSLSDNQVQTIYEDHKGTLWIGTRAGLNQFHEETETFTRYQYDAANPTGLSNDDVNYIFEDYKGFLWIGTGGGGLSYFNRYRKTFVTYQPDDTDAYSLSHNNIQTIFEDQVGTLWIGTDGGGLNQIHRKAENFTRYQYDENDANTLSHNNILAIHEDQQGVLWIGTDGGGLNRLDRSTQRFTHYRYQADDPKRIGSDTISAVYQDQQGNLWIGTADAGLDRLVNKIHPTFQHYRWQEDDPTSLSHQHVNAIYQDRQGTLWIGTNGGGLNKFNPQTQDFTRYQYDETDPNSLSDDKVSSIYEDSNHVLWVGTVGGGLNKFDRGTGLAILCRHDETNPTTLSDDNVYVIYEDTQQRLWIGTAGGLNQYVRSADVFKHYREKEGLANDTVYGILEDDSGNLWLSTNQGLSKFDPDMETFRNYDFRNGLQNNAFNQGAYCRTQSGELFFGGTNGLNSFYPDRLTENPHIPPVVITNFLLFNQPVAVGEASLLQKHISFLDELTLSYQASVFSFEFTALNYIHADKNQYAYKMVGFDQDWTYVDSKRRFVTYTNLGAGEYTFKVKASNNDGLWNEEGKAIHITITPPWWHTIWAYLLYSIIIITSIFGAFRIQQRKLIQTRTINERLQQADKLKDEFLANTSHELRTPLNGIIGIAESLLDGAAGELNANVKANLSMIVNSGRRLATLVNDILDFSKLKHKNLELQLKAVGVREVVEVVLMVCHALLGQKKLKLINAITADLPAAWADENRLQQILYNLVGNAIKFTDEGQITISAELINLTEKGDYILVKIADSGMGIPENQLQKIFQSFEQADGATARKYGGAGLGLAVTKQLVELHGGEIQVHSTYQVGSQFSFTIPVAPADAVPLTTGENEATISTIFQPQQEVEVIIPEQQSAQKGAFKILCIDDEPINLQVLTNHLALQNYEVLQENSGVTALEKIQAGLKPDLVLLDIMMPRMTGYEFCREFRHYFPANELPVLMITAKNQISDLVEGLNVGANDYLVKPVSKSELLAKIKTHLQLAHINTAYSRFVPHQFLQFLNRESIVDVQLGDHVQQEMSVLFSDIRGFTTISETMSPQENFAFINAYLSRMEPAINEYHGFIDKYIGDAIMALFPTCADDAVCAAISMLNKLNVYNETRGRPGRPKLKIGIGIHTGMLMLGTVGGKNRMDGTVIADAVNLASRIEGMTKIYGVDLLVSQSTLERLRDKSNYAVRAIDTVTVKGKSQPVTMYEIFDADPLESIELKKKTLADFEQGVAFFHQREIKQARVCFSRVLQIFPEDKASQFYLDERCQY